MQFGYVTLFAYYFPFASVLAFMINCFEIRFNAYLLCNVVRRPFPKRAAKIGNWIHVMQCMSFAAVSTNIASIFMNTSLFETHVNDQAVMQPPTAKVVLLMFIAEHSFLVLKVACFLPRPHPSPN